ncbi:MAG TPA: hypothetical protein VHM30_14550 [Gemmatimonadaceae bacterium]|nr:hypothetical protein [Gemmatimonadaceae bacterium]
MRIRLTLLAALAAVALSSAPAHASGCPIIELTSDCNALLPDYWQDPTSPWCPLEGCEWLIIH